MQGMSRSLFAAALLFQVCFGQYRRGVNVAGAEFGNTVLPGVLGTQYTFNSENTFRYFSEQGLGLMRVPLQWERLQPVLSGPLNDAYLANIKRDIAWARVHGGELILELHNFGRYSSKGDARQSDIIDNPDSSGVVRVRAVDLADVWVRLSNEFKFEPGVWAYGLMNEPHDMARGNWKAISQTVLSAIRANQDDKVVLIPGDSWSSGNRWVTTHGPNAWIQDPSDNFIYEAHQYFDRDESGTYAQNYDTELRSNADLANVGRTRVAHFIDWCRSNGVRGMVGEYGIPDNDDRWYVVLENFFAALDDAQMEGLYWAAGEWWGNYPLSVQPTNNFTTARPQMRTLLAHAPGGYTLAVSSASLSVQRATAGAFVTLYGRNFPGNPAVEVRDASGAIYQAGLLYNSATQINLRLPPLLASGRARLTVLRDGNPAAWGSITVAPAAPAIFTANSAGFGPAAAQIVRLKADGTQSYEFTTTPIQFGDANERLFLLLYLTGVRPGEGTVRVGDLELTPLYAGPQGQYPGLDQVNVELPRTLAGSGLTPVFVRNGGSVTNTVSLTFR